MNKRIKELAEQCTRYRSYWMTIDNNLVQLTEHVEVFDNEKFAELIILDCADIAAEDSETVGDRIKQYFGVE